MILAGNNCNRIGARPATPRRAVRHLKAMTETLGDSIKASVCIMLQHDLLGKGSVVKSLCRKRAVAKDYDAWIQGCTSPGEPFKSERAQAKSMMWVE